MDIFLFRDLERLRRTGNFSQAAALGNLSQPAFSRRIKSLEAWVGASLVDRSRHPVRLTSAGVQMLEAGLLALDRLEQERSQIIEMQSLPDKYVVRFGAQHSIGWRFYPAWLQALESTFGPVLSRLRADDLPNCLRDLASGDLDFVIAYSLPHTGDPLSDDTLEIGADKLIPVCKPNADGRPMFSFEAPGLAMPYLEFGENAPINEHLQPIFDSFGLQSRLRTVYRNSLVGALRMRAQAGDGVAWLPESLVQPDIDSGVMVPTGDPEWVVDLSIRLFRNQTQSNHVTQAIWTFLQDHQALSLDDRV